MDFKKAKNFHSASFKKESCELSHSQKKCDSDFNGISNAFDLRFLNQTIFQTKLF